MRKPRTYEEGYACMREDAAWSTTGDDDAESFAIRCPSRATLSFPTILPVGYQQ
ncbi:hypothetical protein GCM10022247_70640 [Allokutzneria multivorans]|uniref:Uncharacterized protein n=1 Tax=Allokutzneria multivorans TaxID=1142134 RepID=A0ABP7U309_9PSEU